MIKFSKSANGISSALIPDGLKISPLDKAPVEIGGWYEFESADGKRFLLELYFAQGNLRTSRIKGCFFALESWGDVERYKTQNRLGEKATSKAIDREIERESIRLEK